MKKIVLGEKDLSKHYDFRETCFGIVVKDNKLYCNMKDNEISLIGGGIEKGESHLECLKREFLEETGLIIETAEPLCTVDCFWLTRDNKDMESLANFYVVKVFDKILEPTEEGCDLKIVELENAIDLLPLPYQKRAIEEFLKIKEIKND